MEITSDRRQMALIAGRGRKTLFMKCVTWLQRDRAVRGAGFGDPRQVAERVLDTDGSGRVVAATGKGDRSVLRATEGHVA